MKNNKLLAGVMCGLVIGSVGTSVVGKIQSEKQQVITQQSADNMNSETANTELTDESATVSSDMSSKEEGRGGKASGRHKGQGSLQVEESIDVTSGSYADGSYEGQATGFGGTLKVEVTISNSAISNVEVTSHSETPGFYERAFETVPSEIIANQSTDVDTVSGATYSSVGIINAVNDGLASAASAS